MRTITESIQNQSSGTTNRNYSPSVPLSVYRDLVGELRATQAKLDTLTTKNQELVQENHLLRQEISTAVKSVLHLQKWAYISDDNRVATESPVEHYAETSEFPSQVSPSPEIATTGQEETHRRGEGRRTRHRCGGGLNRPPIGNHQIADFDGGGGPLELIAPDAGLGTQSATRHRVAASPRHPVEPSKLPTPTLPTTPQSHEQNSFFTIPGVEMPLSPEPVYFEEQEVAYYPTSEEKRFPNSWWLGLFVLLIIFTAFGTGYLIVRPLFQNNSR